MLGFALLLMLGVGLVSDAEALIEHRQSWNTNGEEAVLAGYDVVAYHRLGQTAMGSPEFMAEWMGGGVSVCQQSAPQGVLEGFPEVRPTVWGLLQLRGRARLHRPG